MKLSRPCLLALCTLASLANAADSPPVPVVVTTARAENIAASIAATGTVVSRNDARISSEVGATLAWIAEPGSVVRRGDTIARLDVARLSLDLRDNQAASSASTRSWHC